MVNLTEQQRADDSEAGRALRRYAKLFMGEDTPSREDIEGFCDMLQTRVVTDISDVLHLQPRVVTQRQKARASIDFQLSLRVAAATGQRACVWLAQHQQNGQPVNDDLQRHLRRHGTTNSFKGLPSAYVFYEVGYLAAT